MLLMLYDGLPKKGYNIIYTVKAFTFASLYFRLFATPEIFAGLNFRKIFASSKPSFEYFECSPGSNFRLLKPLAKMAKIKHDEKIHFCSIQVHIIATIDIKI